MKLTVFREGIIADRNHPDRLLHLGEDAKPFVDDVFLMVADGMGGRGAYRHEEFDKRIFNEDECAKTFFEGIVQDYDAPVFSDYVKVSFSDFFASRDYYFESVATRRKSAFFGSRVASALFLNIRNTDKRISEKTVFSELAQIEDKAKRQRYLDSFGKDIAARLKAELMQAADNAGFVASKGTSELFATTLCVTLFNECEDGKSVEFINMVVGDSRPYVITEKGMQQTVADCESADGVMTTYICGNPQKPIEFTCKYFKASKPCILFNCSDGCFDSSNFIPSQLIFEELIMRAIAENETMEAASEMLKEYFLTAGFHDDSSTIALKTFGFNEYSDLVAFAKARLQVINEEYVGDFEDILTKDFAYLLEEQDKKILNSFTPIKDVVLADGNVSELLKSDFEADIAVGKYPRLKAQMAQLDAAKSFSDEEKRALSRVIAKYYAWLVDKLSLDGLVDSKRLEKAKEKYEDIAEMVTVARADIADAMICFNQWWSDATELKNEFESKVNGESFTWSYDEFDTDKYMRISQQFAQEIKGLFEGIATKKNIYINKVRRKKKEFYTYNEDIAKAQPEGFERVCIAMLNSEQTIDELGFFGNDADEIYDIISTKSAEVSRLSSEFEVACQKAYAGYVKAKYGAAVKAILNGTLTVTAETKAIIDEKNAVLIEERATIYEKAQLQRKILSKYDDFYNKYMNDETDGEE